MKQTVKTNLPLLTSLTLGVTAALLRRMLYAAALDEKNLIARGHPLELLLWVVTAAALGLLAALILPGKGENSWEKSFRPSLISGLGSLALAAGIVITVLLRPDDMAGNRLCSGLGILSAAGMVWVAVCRIRGSKPFFGCHGVVCLYCCAHLLGQYRVWSSNPQLQDYVFELLMWVCMGLFAYQHAAFEVGEGSRRKLLAYGLAGGFFGLAALHGAYSLPMVAGGAVWMFTNLCRTEQGAAL